METSIPLQIQSRQRRKDGKHEQDGSSPAGSDVWEKEAVEEKRGMRFGGDEVVPDGFINLLGLCARTLRSSSTPLIKDLIPVLFHCSYIDRLYGNLRRKRPQFDTRAATASNSKDRH